MMQKTKIAIVGVGRWGKKLLAEFNKQTEVISACHHGNPETANFLRDTYPNLQITTSLEEILNNPEIEAVAVATPTKTHFEIASQVIRAGKHLFIEKPGSETSRELSELCQLAETKKLCLAVGYEFPHHSASRQIKKLVPPTEMQGIFSCWSKWGTFNDHAVPHLLSHEISVLQNWGIDLLKPRNYQQQTVISSSDIIAVEWENSQGLFISNHINRISPIKGKAITVLGRDKAYIWQDDDLFEVNRETRTRDQITPSTDSAVAAEIIDFLESITEKRQPICGGLSALRVLETIESINFS
ncbi:MAG: Gfo/Idh/MocA family oxidoreductase [Patescibacteria group bacterium]|nr:Gfo/Idh/MocA family oxidoreductase [Patescibacteria group bacterium]